jgi:hypothetical protein
LLIVYVGRQERFLQMFLKVHEMMLKVQIRDFLSRSNKIIHQSIKLT